MRALTALTLLALLPLSALAAPVNGRVALVTDYGTEGFYVGALKGAIVSAFPEVMIDDVTHWVPSFDIAGGSFLLAAAAREWPPGTVFVVIVDPGVGTARRCVALATESGHLFVGPDNGIFTHVVNEMGLAEAHEITNVELLRPGALSSTFHGRDVFGPVGGRLAAGLPLEEVGPRLEDIVRLPSQPPRVEGGEVRGQIALADHYGNLITDVPEAMLAELGVALGDRLILTAGQRTVNAPLVRTYADVPEGTALALINSQGLLEFAVNQGSLAEQMGVESGNPIRLTPESGP